MKQWIRFELTSVTRAPYVCHIFYAMARLSSQRVVPFASAAVAVDSSRMTASSSA